MFRKAKIRDTDINVHKGSSKNSAFFKANENNFPQKEIFNTASPKIYYFLSKYLSPKKVNN